MRLTHRLPRLALSLAALGLALLPLVVDDAFAETAAESGLSVGTAAPRFMLPVVNEEFTGGKRFGPAKWVGESTEKKLVIMSFFATYCEPCKKEMPELVRLSGLYGDQGLGVMLVSIDKGLEQRDEVVALAKQNGVAFPVMHDRFQVVARRYKAERLPYMLMLGPDGVIKTVHTGYTDELKAGLENEVRAHLGLAALPVAATPEKPADDAASEKVSGKKGKGSKGSSKGSKKKGK